MSLQHSSTSGLIETGGPPVSINLLFLSLAFKTVRQKFEEFHRMGILHIYVIGRTKFALCGCAMTSSETYGSLGIPENVHPIRV